MKPFAMFEHTNRMSAITPWVQRTFSFDFSVSMYPNILAVFAVRLPGWMRPSGVFRAID